MKRIFILCLFLTQLLLLSATLQAQICTNNTDSMYGLNSLVGGSGQIVSVSVLNAGSVTVGSPAPSSVNANGLGFSSLNSRFYFFNQCGAGPAEFVSYDPLTGSKVPLASPVPAIPNAQKIRSGAMTPDGLGYYTIYPGATTAQGFPVTGPAFYFYNVGTNSWTLISQSFKDVTNHTVVEIKNLNSGDMTFDGSGNLWIVSSNATSYALYKVNAPLPTTAVASVIVDTILASRATPAGVSITGIAFNSAGKLFLSTGSAAVPGVGHNKLYEMASPSLPLTTIGTLTNGYGDDLTSCATPYYVLPLNNFSFSARLNGSSVLINWENKEENGLNGYAVEYSPDGINWSVVNRVTSEKLTGSYSYVHPVNKEGIYYYRLAILSVNAEKKYSVVKTVHVKTLSQVFMGPNPAVNTVQLYSGNPLGIYNVTMFDNAGRLLQSWEKLNASQSIDISRFKSGLYIFRISEHNKQNTQYIRVIKE